MNEVYHAGEYIEMPLNVFLKTRTNFCWWFSGSVKSKLEKISKDSERYIIRFNVYGFELGFPEDKFSKFI